MKKIISNELLKNIGYILGYWFILIIIPFLCIKQSRNFDNISVEVLIYILFIAPFLYFIPYLFAKPKSKLLFIFYGLMLPYLLIYFLIYISTNLVPFG
jgi:hypothetical protein